MSEESRIHSFGPIVGAEPRVLILGSMPGRESLSRGQYYGHPSNHFWRLISDVLGEDCPNDYILRIEMLERRGIALWDSIASCVRESSSLDSKIRSVTPNPVSEVLSRYPSIRAVAFNGKKAEKEFYRFNELPNNVAGISLPSSSPIPRKGYITIDEKYAEWRKIREFL